MAARGDVNLSKKERKAGREAASRHAPRMVSPRSTMIRSGFLTAITEGDIVVLR